MDEIQVNQEMVDEFVTFPKSDPQGARIECRTKLPNLPDSILTISLADIQDGRVRLIPIMDDDFEGFFVNCSGTMLYCKADTRKIICDWLHEQNTALGTNSTFK